MSTRSDEKFGLLIPKQNPPLLGWLIGACPWHSKSFRCLIHRGEDLDYLVNFRHFQAIVDHRLGRGDAQPAASALQLRKAPHNSSDHRAVGMCHTGHVEDYPRLACRNHLIHFSLEPGAFRAAMDVAFYFQCGHAWLNSPFCKFQDQDAARSSPSYGNCRINRTQSPSAENIDGPHPHGTNGAVFWFTALSASA